MVKISGNVQLAGYYKEYGNLIYATVKVCLFYFLTMPKLLSKYNYLTLSKPMSILNIEPVYFKINNNCNTLFIL